MRLFCAMLVCGLVAATSSAEDKKKAAKATVQITGEFTADKDTTLGYTLKKGGKVVAEEKGLTALPGKTLEIDAADAGGPFDLRVHSDGSGAVKVSKIGVTVVAGGQTSQGAFAATPWSLGAPSPNGVIRAMTVPIVPVVVKTEEPKKIVELKKKIDEPKKEEPKKKADEPKKEEPKKADEPKKEEPKKEEPKKTEDKKPDDEKKKEDEKKD